MANYILTENDDNFPGPNNNFGDDSINALGGDDTVAAGARDDTVHAGAGNDLVFGEIHDDVLYGEAGGDTLDGGKGDDRLEGGEGADSLYGGGDSDVLEGGPGADFMDGGVGAYSDIVSYAHSSAAVTIDLLSGIHTGDAAGDTYVNLEAYELTNFDDVFVGDLDGRVVTLGGNDTVTGARTADGGEGDDILLGDEDRDFLYGAEGADTLEGGRNTDRLDGDAGADKVSGGGGDDSVTGAPGDDVLSGGRGADTLAGGVGADRLSGGAGADRFDFAKVSESPAHRPDLIRDLSDEDLIRLRSVDADVATAGDQAFHLVAALTGQVGELALRYDAERNLTFLEGDVDGDGEADLVVAIVGDHTGFTNFDL